MSRSPLTRMRQVATGDSGVVLVTVLLTAFVMSLLGAALLVYVTQQMPQAAEHQDRQAALAAAEAGIEDYLQRINADPEYYLLGDTDATNPAFAGFIALPGAQDATAQYRIDSVETGGVATRGVIVVEATGRVGGQERSVRVELAREKFTDYAYLSDLEVNDPRNRVAYPSLSTVSDTDRIAELETRCANYRWPSGRPATPSGRQNCAELQWYNGDITDGKVHTNDLIGMSGSPKFNAQVSSGCFGPVACGASVSSGVYKNYYESGSPSPLFTYSPAGVMARGNVPFPEDNKALSIQAKPPNKGCLFTGPTRIVLRGSYAEVWNRNSKQTNGPSCGGNYTTKSGVGWKHDVPMTDDGLVIYVQNIPADSADPNYTASGSVFSTAPFIPGTKPANAPATYRPSSGSAATLTTPNGFPLPEDKGTDVGIYGPTQGDVLIEGTLDGRLTVGAEDDIIITGDILRKDATGDLVGLVANNFLWNYHPVNATSGNGDQYELCANPCMENVRIEASIMSVNHAYGTPYYRVGWSKGTIYTYGSLVQKWRNNVGSGSFGTAGHTGYAKRYGYDPQLQFTQPPHFLQPEFLVWGVSRWAES